MIVLLAGTTRPLSGREVARLIGRAQNTVRLALKRLSDQGLVDVAEAGRGAALLYSLNRDHLAAPAVELLAGLRQRLIDKLQEAMASWELAPTHASVFGSAARGDGDTTSDIDLLIVRPADVSEEDSRWRAQLADLAHDVRRWTGNHTGISEVSAPDLAALLAERPRVVDDMRRDAITLIGTPARELLGTWRSEPV